MTPLMLDLRDNAAVVTGAGSGIGVAIARTLAQAGASVVAADLDEAAAEETAAAIALEGGRAIAAPVDVADRAAVQALRERAVAAFGTVTILVNNAGWGQPGLFIDNEPEIWDKLVAVNFMGPVNVTRAFLDPMIEARRGQIVNIASDAGRVGSTEETVYAGTKGGVIAFTKSLAREVARYSVGVNCVCPGPTDTPLFAKHTDKMREAIIRAIPFRRMARPEEIAGAVAFFASDHAAYITGQVLSVSGGLTMVG
jgi:2-hydroxycyclohexanecarboxyl-CoA dehydrogenase